MKTLTIKDLVIENISVGEPGSAAPPGYDFVSVNDDLSAGVGWTWDGEIATDPTPPPTPEPVADWVGFNTEFLSNANWTTIAAQLPTDLRTGIAASAATANPSALQSAYSIAKAIIEGGGMSLDPLILAEWQAIADDHNIPITF